MMKQELNDVIVTHNRMIETIQNAEMTCTLFRGMEVWHKIACEGAAITHAARSAGIDAKVDMQAGIIHVGVETVELPKLVCLTVTEIIRNLEDQVRDRESSIDPDDPDCIFRRDAAALRAAVKLLRDMEART